MDISQLLAKANEEIISLKNQLSSQKGVNTKLKNVISDLHQQLAVMANKYEQMLKNSDRMSRCFREGNLSPCSHDCIVRTGTPRASASSSCVIRFDCLIFLIIWYLFLNCYSIF